MGFLFNNIYMSKTYFNWSSGKDSALALYHLLENTTHEVDLLLTTVNQDYNRISMHGLHENLLDLQVKSIGLPLKKIYLSGDVNMADYDAVMKKTMQKLKKNNYCYAGFGDIFLEDLKVYRERKLDEIGIKAIFPLWKQDTKKVLRQFLDLGFKAITVCVNAKLLDKSFVGRIINEAFIDDLPSTVDVCGENGEFHTFVFDGPIFKYPIDYVKGEIVLKSYNTSDTENNNLDLNDKQITWDNAFWYCDLLPKVKPSSMF